jgi:hypothetical protein
LTGSSTDLLSTVTVLELELMRHGPFKKEAGQNLEQPVKRRRSPGLPNRGLPVGR